MHNFCLNDRDDPLPNLWCLWNHSWSPITIIIAIEQTHNREWMNHWIESDSKLAIQASKSQYIVSWDLRNRWSNCIDLHVRIMFSHVFREGNSCADKLAALGHDCSDFSWWDIVTVSLLWNFFKDRCNLPNFCFWGFDLVSSFLYFFVPFFFNNIYECFYSG
jgi:hypothetical protein